MSKITAGKLSKILKEHKRWIDTDEDEGEKTDLSGADLSDAKLSNANLEKANLSDAKLSNANLEKANLSDANLSRANLRFANLSDANLVCSNLRRADLSGADLSGAELINADLSEAQLGNANLFGADLCDANLFETNLCDANLSKANLGDADLNCALLRRADLSGASLFCANLNHAYLRDAILAGTNFEFACLLRADLKGVNLREANLSGITLVAAYLKGTDLSHANLSSANLSEADMSNANLFGADLRGTDLSESDLSGANLIRVRGLTIEQLSSVETLCDAKLSSELMEQVKDKYPHLLGEIELVEEELSKPRIITLRSSYKKLSVSEVQSMPNVTIHEKVEDFFGHASGLICHSTINHDYNPKTIRRRKVVVDNATGLMWHQSGTDYEMERGLSTMTFDNYISRKINEWVEDLNSEGYAGYNDWRLPTVDEAVSLLESSEKNGDLYIDPVFSKKQEYIWMGDMFDGSTIAWVVNFDHGIVHWGDVVDHFYVRPVRSVR